MQPADKVMISFENPKQNDLKAFQASAEDWRAEICDNMHLMTQDIVQREEIFKAIISETNFKEIAMKHQQSFVRAHTSFCLSLLDEKHSREILHALKKNPGVADDLADQTETELSSSDTEKPKELRQSLRELKQLCTDIKD